MNTTTGRRKICIFVVVWVSLLWLLTVWYLSLNSSTDYVVRPSTGDERQVFQIQVCCDSGIIFFINNILPFFPRTWALKADVIFVFVLQEQQRYNQPHKAFTFRMHGFESVVGPVKGVFDKEMSLNKAREHTLLRSDRPPYVTILSLG